MEKRRGGGKALCISHLLCAGTEGAGPVNIGRGSNRHQELRSGFAFVLTTQGGGIFPSKVGRGRLGLRDDAVDTDQLGSSWDLKEPYGAWHMACSRKQGHWLLQNILDA